MATLDVVSAGAAKGLVEALRRDLRERGIEVRGVFGAVGAMREHLLAGAPCDVLILTTTMLVALARDGRVAQETIAPLGKVATGIAVRNGTAHPPLTDRAALSAALAAAPAWYCPDPERATAGIHFASVLRALDLWPLASTRLRPFASGAVAMAALARAGEPGALGCTQVTEILYTSGVALVGKLPPGFALTTEYAAAVTSAARLPDVASDLVETLAGARTRALRQEGGFDD